MKEHVASYVPQKFIHKMLERGMTTEDVVPQKFVALHYTLIKHPLNPVERQA